MEPDPMRLSMMAVAENFAPMHELVEGEVAHFLRQGHTAEQALAMAAAEFVTAFGMRIENSQTRPDTE